jgi:hydantoinase/carbamoylase family amidase
VSESRLLQDLAELAQIGRTGDGVTRVAWSAALVDANQWLVARLSEAGLAAQIDPAGNVIGRWDAAQGTAIVVGSHIDTVPNGGRYDGALGVLAGLEAIRRLRERGFRPRRPIWLVSFMDEEGTRFGTALFGSRAFAGEPLAGTGDRRDARDTTMRDAMTAAGFDYGQVKAARAIDGVAAYLELHIEQGPVLEESGIEAGIVTSIVGLHQYRVRLVGEANHAGTTPMARRRDALAGAARIVLALREEALARDGMTANVGRIRVEPAGVNVVPGACEFTVDVRAPDPAGFVAADRFVRETVALVAAGERLEPELEQTQRVEPLPLFEDLQQTLERAAEAAGASHVRLPSGAGHDAMVIGRHVPAAMLFVPSRGGVSHSPLEHTDPAHCEVGARILERALEELAA